MEGDVRIIRSDALEATGEVRCGVSTRTGGASGAPLGMNLSFRVGDDPKNVHRNRQLFFGALGIALDTLAVPGQIHGDTVLRVDAPGDYPDCDALVTKARDVCLGISVADCLPILVFDPVKKAIAAIHAGWRGTAGGITGRAIVTMEREFGSKAHDLLVHVGPGAGVCCYAVGDDVATLFDSRFRFRRNGRCYLDLKAAIALQLKDAGVKPANIEMSPHCTISEPDLFHSFRRDGVKSGRMMGVVGLYPQSSVSQFESGGAD